jgi:4-aminobutyrate aminotransferase-like enzyme
MNNEGLIDNAKISGISAFQRKQTLQNCFPQIIGAVRGTGSMPGDDIGLAGDNKEKNQKLTRTLSYRYIENGLILNYSGHGNKVSLSFPLTVTKCELDGAFDILEQALTSIVSKSPEPGQVLLQ